MRDHARLDDIYGEGVAKTVRTPFGDTGRRTTGIQTAGRDDITGTIGKDALAVDAPRALSAVVKRDLHIGAGNGVGNSGVGGRIWKVDQAAAADVRIGMCTIERDRLVVKEPGDREAVERNRNDCAGITPQLTDRPGDRDRTFAGPVKRTVGTVVSDRNLAVAIGSIKCDQCVTDRGGIRATRTIDYPLHELAARGRAGNAIIRDHGSVHVIKCCVGLGRNTGRIIRGSLQIGVGRSVVAVVGIVLVTGGQSAGEGNNKEETVECCGFHNDLEFF